MSTTGVTTLLSRTQSSLFTNSFDRLVSPTDFLLSMVVLIMSVPEVVVVVVEVVAIVDN